MRAEPRRVRRGGARRRVRFALGYGLLCRVRMMSNLQSTGMTAAYNVQMAAMALTQLSRRFVTRTKTNNDQIYETGSDGPCGARAPPQKID